jgi:hypothetical protein
VARARKALAIFLYRFATYQLELNTDVLEMVKTELPALTAPLGAAKLDNQAEAQQHPNGSFKFQYGMYVDDGLSAIPVNEPNGVHRMVASSCKAAYLLLGYPGPIQNPTMPPTMSWDKMQDRPVNPFRDSLGLAIDGDRMEVTIPAKQLDRLFDILMRHWTPNRLPKRPTTRNKTSAAHGPPRGSNNEASAWGLTAQAQPRHTQQI